jgi:hypothetical protein
MKTKNVRVRAKDIKQGVRIFISHPFFGVEELLVAGRPYVSKYSGFIFVKAVTEYSQGHEFSLDDAGISAGESYNDRRSFFKRKHAEDWAAKMSKDPHVIDRHERHLDLCNELSGF